MNYYMMEDKPAAYAARSISEAIDLKTRFSIATAIATAGQVPQHDSNCEANSGEEQGVYIEYILYVLDLCPCVCRSSGLACTLLKHTQSQYRSNT